ncbi:hypothetical protein Cni_G13771 [Canna indica]|uniref:NAB domain-containing protein n=1 Tax=Canna indica TaxID=4628 RepID=A0AAQ3KD88_9LILI|nr:hypothetical protein Cni_G13771 [Canna indica]
MATLTDAESRRLYSWWWDSHISPKHSKWLRDNLSDMDNKIKTMIRLVEEDADSFAQRAEMYYKKRPELIKLVEEFYRAYRALAERYDHVTGALRQAHRTIAEAFPNQIPLELCDESLYESPASDSGMNHHEMPQGTFDPDGLLHKLLGMTLHDEAVKPNEVKPYDVCLKQLDEMFLTRDHSNFVGGREGKFSEYKLPQKEISRLSKENQDLKKQIASESMRADKNENDIQQLKETYSKVESDKEDALTRYQESMARVSYLEDEISLTKAELEKLNDEMIIESSCFNSAEERSLVLEKANQSLQSELGILKQKIKEQQEKFHKNVKELEILNISLQNEQQRNLKVEMAFQSVEKRHIEAEEDMKHLKLEIKYGVEKLKDVEEELQKISEENARLSEQKLSSAQRIMSLQDEIISLMDLKRKLEDEADLHIEEKEALQLELSCLTEDRNDLEQKYHALMEEIQAVNLKVEALQALIMNLEDRNLDLKDTIKKYEDEKNLYLENLNYMQTMPEKNAVLEASLLETKDELERLRVKIKELEESSNHLRSRISIYLVEKAALISHMDASAENMEKLMNKNTFLGNSLCGLNLELDGLKEKMKGLEESCRSLHDENWCLLSEKNALITQVESIKKDLENLEGRYHELEDKTSNLRREKDSTFHHMAKLQELLRLEKEEHNTLVQSSKSHLSTLENQILILQEECRQREEDFDMEQHKILSAQIEILILHRCLCEMKEEKSVLSVRSHKFQEALRCTEKRILELERECLTQDKKIKSIVEHNEKLREWIHLVLKSLKIDLPLIYLDDIKDDILLQLALHEIRRMIDTISEAQDEKQHLLLEKSVVVTLLEQFGKYVTDLKAEKTTLQRESEIQLQELTQLKNKNDDFLKMNECLRKEMHASNQREEELKGEVDLLFRQLTYLQESHCTLQTEIPKILAENNLMSKKIHDFSDAKFRLEEENNDLLRDVVALDCFSLMFKNLNSERGFELQLLSNERGHLLMVKDKLEQDIKRLNKKVEVLEVENTHLNESSSKLNECRNLLTVQNNIGNFESDTEGSSLMEYGANWRLKRAQNMRSELHTDLNDIMMDVYDDGDREDIENRFCILLEDCTCNENGIECLHQENNALKGQLSKLQKDVEDLSSRDEKLTSALQKRIDEVQSADVLITSLLQNILFEMINASVCKEKVLELIHTCKNIESSAMLQREVVQEETTLRNLTLNQLDKKIQLLEGENSELRTDLSAYSLFLGSLWDDILILEELTLSLAKRHSTSTSQKEEDYQVEPYPCTASPSNQEMDLDYNPRTPPGLLKLQNLHDKIKELQEVMINTGSMLELERFDSNASLEAAWNAIEGLKSKKIPDNKISRSKYKRLMKDLQFDIVLNSSGYGNGILSHRLRKPKKAVGSNDQVLELWGIAEGYGNRKQKGPLVFENDITCYQTEEEDNYTSGELATKKELGVDKHELPRRVVPHQEWNKRVIQRLVSDAQRLLVLQASAQELQNSVEKSEKINHPSRSEFTVIKVQLQEAAGSISELIDVNSKLKGKVEELYTSPLYQVKEKEIWSKKQKQISDWAKKVSEKIGRLELEMPKIQYTLLKFDEEHMNKRARARRQSGIRLKEYIYGRRNSRRRMDDSSCCMRPTTCD